MLTRTSVPVTARGNASPKTRPTQRQALNSGKRKAAAVSSTSAFPLPLKCRRASAQAKAAHICKQTNTLQRITEISNLKLQRKAGAHRPFRALRDRDRQPGCRSRKSIRLYDSLTDRDSRPDGTRPHHIHCHCTLHLAMFSVWHLFSTNTCGCVCECLANSHAATVYIRAPCALASDWCVYTTTFDTGAAVSHANNIGTLHYIHTHLALSVTLIKILTYITDLSWAYIGVFQFLHFSIRSDYQYQSPQPSPHPPINAHALSKKTAS
jgi:hypothetical protein